MPASCPPRRSSDLQFDARITQKQIRAPFAGELGIRRVNLGQYLNPGDPVATLTALDRLFVDFTLPQQELAKLHVGAPVTIKEDPRPERSFTGHVNAIEPPLGADTRNVTVQGGVANAHHHLSPGMYVAPERNHPPPNGGIRTEEHTYDLQ